MNIKELIRILKLDWKIILLISLFQVFSGLAYIINQEEVYEISAKLIEPERLESKAGSNFPSLNLGVVNFQSSNLSDLDYFSEILKTRDFFIRLNKKYNIDELLGFDQDYKDKLSDDDLFMSLNNKWNQFNKSVSFRYSLGKSVGILEVKSVSSAYAKNLIDAILLESNLYASEIDKDRFQKNIDFISEQLSKVKVESTRDTLQKILQSEYQSLMYTYHEDSYLFQVLSHPAEMGVKVWPKKTSFMIFVTIFSFFNSILIIAIRRLWWD